MLNSNGPFVWHLRLPQSKMFVEDHTDLTDPRNPRTLTRARPGQSPVPGRNKLSALHLLLLFVLSLRLPDVGAKEAVIFEQFGQMAGITAYLHIHVELSISSVEAQLSKYCQLLNQNCYSELSVLNYMLTYVNMSITNFTLKKDFPDRPENFPEKSMIRQNAKLWYKVAQLHLPDLEEMEESIATLRKSLPVVPNRNTGKIPVQAQYAPPQGAHVINMQAYSDTHDHLLTLIPEKSPMNLRTNSQGLVEMPEPRNITLSSSAGKTTGPTITKASRTQEPRRTEREDRPAPEFIWGRRWNFPGRGTSQPLTPEAMDEMTLI
jgi:hypothetical protein